MTPMPDPQVLYIVTAVVVAGLMAWVVFVLLRPAAPATSEVAGSASTAAPTGTAEKKDASVPPSEPSRSAQEPASRPSRAPLNSHEEIQDESPPKHAGAGALDLRHAGAGALDLRYAGAGALDLRYAGAGAPDLRHAGAGALDLRHAGAGALDLRHAGAGAPDLTADRGGDVEEEEEPTGPNALILVTAVGRTDPGLKRKHNEDAYATLEDHHLFVIADGMGRYAAGEVASQLCVEAIRKAFTTGDFGPPTTPPVPKRAGRIRGAILLANKSIRAAAQDNDAYAGMGTTVVAAYFSANNQRVYIAHVGDSRCYRLRAKELVQLTTDHTLGAAGIQGKSAAVLSRAVGVEENVEVDIATESPLPGDIYLLCSDGLSRMVSGDEIETTILSAPNLDVATKQLIDMANERGGRDNITAILVRVDDARR
jgi:protein phosphatase